MKIGIKLSLSAVIFLLVLAIAQSKQKDRPLFCSNGTEISMTSLCDGIRDCEDGTDEIYTGRGFKCRFKHSDNARNCVIPQSLVQDNVSDCIDDSDLCFDENQLLIAHRCFQCLDGNQIVALSQVCDGVIDCDDFSDECLCLNNGLAQSNFKKNPACNHLCQASTPPIRGMEESSCKLCNIGEFQCLSSSSSNSDNVSRLGRNSTATQTLLCLPMHKICDGITDCPYADDEAYCPHSDICADGKMKATACDGRVTCADFSDECAANCWNRPQYCEQVVGNRFRCNDYDETNSSIIRNNSYVRFDQLCDQIEACPVSGDDEKYCSTSSHFYCWNGKKLFVNQSSRFNEITDCEDKSDECAAEFKFSSEEMEFIRQDDIIKYPLIQIMVWIVAIIALTGNLLVIVSTSQDLLKDRRAKTLGKLAKCNRSFVLHLAVADFMMSVSLIILAINGAIMANNYCVVDRAWRTGRLCVLMGIMTLCSSQMSVFVLLLMTSYRLYGTLHPFRVEESKLMRGATTVTFAAWFVSVGIAVIPQCRFACDYFINKYWLPVSFVNFDLLNRSDMEQLVRTIHTLTSNSTRTPLPDLKWPTMMDHIWKSNITVMHKSWNKQNLIPIGFYNRYPICQPLFYPQVGDTGWEYMTAIVIFNFLAFIYMLFAYIVIYKASSRPCVRKSVRRRTKQWRQDNRKMQRKIFFLIFSDMACWLPICVITILKLSGVTLHPIVHGVTGVILLPVNSALNPLLYSNIFSNFLCRLLRKKKSPFEPPTLSNDAIISTKASIGSLLNIKTLVNSPKPSRNNAKRHGKTKLNSKLRRVRFTSETSSKGSADDDANDQTVTFLTKNTDTKKILMAEDVINADIKESKI